MNEARSKTDNEPPDSIQSLKWEEIPDEVRAGIEAMKDKKVEDLRVYDLREFTPFCDFVILGTVLSPAQAMVVKSTIIETLEKHGLKLYGIEGENDSNWLLIDFWDVVVHVFRPEMRKYYNLEALWADLPWWPGEFEV